MATIKDGGLFVTKSVRIPVDRIFKIVFDRVTGNTKIITDRGVTYVEDPFFELEALLPDLCGEVR